MGGRVEDPVGRGQGGGGRGEAGDVVHGGGGPTALKRFLPQGRSAPPFSLFADYVVIGEDDKVVLEGYFRDGYRIPGR